MINAYTTTINKFSQEHRIMLTIWFAIAIIFSIQGIVTDRYNNYLIFENSFHHLDMEAPLYASYPNKYQDVFHSGPLFALMMKPFYWLDSTSGLICWNIMNVITLFLALQLIPLSKRSRNIICLLALPDLVASTLSEQFNPLLAASIILSFVLVKKDQLFWATFFIVAGTLSKLYGIVGIVFFIFTLRKTTFIGYLLLWTFILLVLPVVYSSPEYVLNSYQDWFYSLQEKNSTNISLTSTQDVSVMGLFRRILGKPGLSTLPFIISAMAIFGSVLLRMKKFSDPKFQLLTLAAVLIMPVIFSTGSEDVTYIIAIAGAGIYFVMAEKSRWLDFLLAITILVSAFPLWTILPLGFRMNHPFIYVFKVIPYLLVWLTIIATLHGIGTNKKPG